jgi:hypothetical protein
MSFSKMWFSKCENMFFDILRQVSVSRPTRGRRTRHHLRTWWHVGGACTPSAYKDPTCFGIWEVSEGNDEIDKISTRWTIIVLSFIIIEIYKIIDFLRWMSTVWLVCTFCSCEYRNPPCPAGHQRSQPLGKCFNRGRGSVEDPHLVRRNRHSWDVSSRNNCLSSSHDNCRDPIEDDGTGPPVCFFVPVKTCRLSDRHHVIFFRLCWRS